MVPVATNAAASPSASAEPPLPPVDTLTIDSDFAPFLQPKVAEDVKRAALKKLFSDPQFNVMDGLDIYIGDYTQPDPMPDGMLDKLGKVYGMLDQPSLTKRPTARRRRSMPSPPSAPAHRIRARRAMPRPTLRLPHRLSSARADADSPTRSRVRPGACRRKPAARAAEPDLHRRIPPRRAVVAPAAKPSSR